MKRSRNRSLWLFLAAMLMSASAGPPGTTKIPFVGRDFTTDYLGNIFMISEDNSVTKYTPSGRILTTINNKLLGRLEYIDVSNPFELYLYYKDQNKVVYTDNMFGFRGETDLNELEVANISLVARSYDNELWVWDQNDLKLKKYSKNLELLAESGNSRMWADGYVDPAFMVDNGKQVFVSDPQNGIYVFDAFANHYKTIPVKDVSEFQVLGNQLIFYRNHVLSTYDLKFLQWYHSDTLKAEKVRMEQEYRFRRIGDTLFVDQLKPRK